MIDSASLSAAVQASALVGAVLVEAVVLYAGYGALERVAAPPIVDTIRGA